MTDARASSSSAYSSTFDINRNMSDTQLRQTWNEISSAANASFASPTPQAAHSKTYMKNLHNWSTTSTPPPRSAASGTRSQRARTTRTSNLANTPTSYALPVYQTTSLPTIPILPIVTPNPPRPPLPSTPQALQSTYSARLRTGATLLMQPIFSTNPSASNTRATTRRGGVINYADPGSGDDLPDAGALDSDDSDFIASGGTRTSIRQTKTGRVNNGMSVFNSTTGVSTPRPAQLQLPEKAELDQTYLGMIPPTRFIKPRPMAPTPHEYPTSDVMEYEATKRTALVPIRVEFETDTHRIRDCFVWNANESLIKPETFAKIFCNDLDLPSHPWVETVAAQIRAQLEDYEAVASIDIGMDGAMDVDAVPANNEEASECRVILSIDVQVGNHHLVDLIEWDLLSPLTPETFSQKLCMELGLSGEAAPLIAHAVHEELVKHKKDVIEWGVIGADKEVPDDGQRDRGGLAIVKDKTGLGLSWGRAPKDGRGPKTLKSAWRDWTDAEEFRTVFEELTAEEVERREIERERASRRLRRETSKFQTSTRNRRR